ncbi:MAG TPA: DUF2974 domain-containing protein [Erysipelotrichaceae bacterium]|nr:DUF2974 domain-containing protein [Erysipelotrichaceae bacterium]
MNVIDYLLEYQKFTFKEESFNEIDALVLTAVSYFPFNGLKTKKDVLNTKQLAALLDTYLLPVDAGERQINYLKVLKIVTNSLRYKKAKFAYYSKVKSKADSKQFQAITIILPEFVYLSFGGTDGTLTGWKEDFDMAYLDIVPSEIEAIKYANAIAKKFFFRPFIFGGHSKGGRLAITAAKNFKKPHKLKAIYSYDAPNYSPNFYDEEYKKISPLIHAYAPAESIIGRLMVIDKEKIIVASSKSLLMQHDLFTWLINDGSFIREEQYSERSTRIVEGINEAFLNYDNNNKRAFVDALFALLEKLDIEVLPKENEIISFIRHRFSLLRSCWKETPKKERDTLVKIVFNIGKEFFLRRDKK